MVEIEGVRGSFEPNDYEYRPGRRADLQSRRSSAGDVAWCRRVCEVGRPARRRSRSPRRPPCLLPRVGTGGRRSFDQAQRLVPMDNEGPRMVRCRRPVGRAVPADYWAAAATAWGSEAVLPRTNLTARTAKPRLLRPRWTCRGGLAPDCS